MESNRQEHEGAIAQWRSNHQSNPCFPSALQSLRELFHDDSTGGLNVFRSCLKEPTPRPHSQKASVLGSRGSPSPSTEPSPLPPLVNAQSLGLGRPTKFFLPRNGFLGTLALIGHRLQVPEVTNKSGSSSLSSIIETQDPSMSKGGTPDWCPTKSFPLATLQPPIPPPPTPPGSPAPGVASGTLPLPTPGTLPPTAGPLLLRLHGNIKLLGAAIGTQEWCESLLQRRVAKAKNLLDAFDRYYDAQGAFTLLRSCGGWAKILYSCRTVPLPLQRDGLRQADMDIRHSLGRLVGGPLSDDALAYRNHRGLQWRPRCTQRLRTRSGGLHLKPCPNSDAMHTDLVCF